VSARQRLAEPVYFTGYCDRSFAVCGPTVWNSLPASLRSTDSFAAFCRQLKTFLSDSVTA